jgi:hypothetical protein
MGWTMSNPQNNEPEHDDVADQVAPDPGEQSLAETELEQPSTGYAPGEEPKAPADDTEEPSHEAVGIGIIDAPPLEAGDDD